MYKRQDSFLVAITENRSVEDIEWLAHMLEHGQAGWGEHIHDHDEEGNPVNGNGHLETSGEAVR